MARKGSIYVLFQFLFIIILLSRSSIQEGYLANLDKISGIIVGLWAIYAVRHAKPNVFPEVREGMVLIKTGPYQWIRHPMYSAILLFFFPTFKDNIDPIYVVAYLLLAVVLILKLSYEEDLLIERFDGYEAYKKKTKRLIPFIY